MNNSKHYDLRICVESIHRGSAREIAYARTLLREVFKDVEEFRVYFGLKADAPVIRIVVGEKP